MGWLVAVIAIIAFLGFLFRFPKQTLGCAGIVVGGIAFLYLAFIYFPQQERARRESQVVVNVKYDIEACSASYPLLVAVFNKSDKTVERVSLRIEAYVPGHSTDLSGYDHDVDVDKILAPGENHQACYPLPSQLKWPRESAGQLEYRLSDYGKFVSFR